MDINHANENKDVVSNPELGRKTKTDITGLAAKTTALYFGAQKSLIHNRNFRNKSKEVLNQQA